MGVGRYFAPSAAYYYLWLFTHQLMKIPPVTRFLSCGSVLLYIAVYLHWTRYWDLLYFREAVVDKYEIWRIPTSFMYGNRGLNFLLDLVLLYRYSDILEAGPYINQSTSYAWQFVLACTTIILVNTPLGCTTHHRPLVVCITYVCAALSPPESEITALGFATLPLSYLPYVIIVLDIMARGSRGAAECIGGAIVGHLWWWGFWNQGFVAKYGNAPKWMSLFVSDGVVRDMDDEDSKGWGSKKAKRPHIWGSSVTLTADRNAGLGGGCCGGATRGLL